MPALKQRGPLPLHGLVCTVINDVQERGSDDRIIVKLHGELLLLTRYCGGTAGAEVGCLDMAWTNQEIPKWVRYRQLDSRISDPQLLSELDLLDHLGQVAIHKHCSAMYFE